MSKGFERATKGVVAMVVVGVLDVIATEDGEFSTTTRPLTLKVNMTYWLDLSTHPNEVGMFDEFLFVVVESTCHGCVFPDARAAAAADDEPRIPGTARTACAGHDGAEPGPAEAATIFRDSGERDGDQTSAGLVERPDQGIFHSHCLYETHSLERQPT